jgi:molybdate/tungstate transport system substrate-binding protein
VRPARLLAALLLAAACAAPARAGAPGVVSVLYSGSLVVPMTGQIKSDLAGQGIDLQGEPGGSIQLESMIEAGQRTPDVFISSDRDLVTKLGDKVASATTFATTELGMGWAGKSNYAYAFEAVGKGEMPLLVALAQPGLRIGRTNPAKDPKGRLTIDALAELLGAPNEKRILGADDNPTQLYPESELASRVENGELDVAFMYASEARARYFEFVPFPGESSMSDRIQYTLAIMKDAQHPAQARAFADFILEGPGREILEKLGLKYLNEARATAGSP